MLDRIFPHTWMAMPATTRDAIRKALNLPCTGQTEVRTTGGGDSVLVSDGLTEKDLATITKELLIEYVKPNDNDLDFPKLWEMAVYKADITLSLVKEKPVEKVDSDITGDNKENNDSKESVEEGTKE